MPVFQINFSRPAGQIIASYYNFLRLGSDGYSRGGRDLRPAPWGPSSLLVSDLRPSVKCGE